MSKNNFGNRFILGLAVAFLLPLSFYMIARLLSKDKIHLPAHYGVERVEETVVDGKQVADTIYHKVGDISLTNQLGDNFTTNGTLGGRILVINFFFTTCPTICPKLTGNTWLLQRAFRRNPKIENGLDQAVHFISISVDPANDTVQALRAYADRYKADHDRWWFATGDKKSIYDFARNELKLVTGPGDGGADDFIHSQKLVLIDAKRYIRGYYDGLDTADVKRCADDIVLLTMEKEKKRK